jgi:Ca-activated chloride channel homolog
MNCARVIPAALTTLVLAIVAPAVLILTMFAQAGLAKTAGLASEGRLEAWDAKGQALGGCPLKHTRVSVDIAGFIARVTVRQQFHNPFAEKIEAVYVFPLSQDAAVDQMTMKIGKRIIKGQIKERGEARAIYESAKSRGKVASLLDQERPNIFTQAVANIEPGAAVDITIAYSETLKWKDGQYEFSFPMVVEPRYMPGQPTGAATTGWAPPTNQVPDANRISPPVTPEGTRAGHDISVTVNLNAGLPIRQLDCRQHAVEVSYPAADQSRAVVRLQDRKTIPNKDFVLVYQTAGDEIADAVLAHTDQRGKFFTLVLQPPKRVRKEVVVPKEIIFAIDKSGSMSGFPIETAKKAMRMCIEGAHEKDTFNLICFDGGTSSCFAKPVANTEENRRRALAFLDDLRGGGGTEMMTAINACLEGQDDPQRVRIVCFMTDGCVGNDMAIIDAVKRNAGIARVFSFGIGHSVNRYLLDGIARAGRGEVHYILDERGVPGAAERFQERVRSPVLTDVKLDFGGLAVAELYPRQIPDLFSSTPIVVKGQYKQAGKGTITLSGKTGTGRFERKITVELPAEEAKNDVLAPLWARAKIEELMNRDLAAVQEGRPNPAAKEEILGLGLRFQLLTQFTSFVAVEETITTAGGQPKTVAVPVEMPEGVSYEGIFGGGGVGFWGAGSGPRVTGPGGLGVGLGTGSAWGSGGDGMGFGGRGRKKAMLSAGGGTKHSERTVSSSLIWLAQHQLSNGSWRFDQPAGDARSYANPGTWKTEAGATGLAVLPFLGAGQTHKAKGPYRVNISAGLNWLIQHQKADGDLSAGGSPRMFSHAVATLALCEAYGMTGDRRVGMAAQGAINFIIAAQDSKTGGWAEQPDQSPAMSVSAWQIMALASSKMAGLNVPAGVFDKAGKFLDTLQADGGARYGETSPLDGSNAATALGLASRTRVGSKMDKKQKEGLDSAVDLLVKIGPSPDDAVSNYFSKAFLYAVRFSDSRVREKYDSWMRKIRKQLVDTQAQQGGNEAGSWWNPNDVNATRGGRLFQTTLNALTLEVYYPNLPLFKAPEEVGPVQNR